ncbi:sensor histidine kinase [Rhodococcus sp. MALMAid1271]|uniref:sensor histidine kinase n=1 Tax=Rhodococcus sp. MALMAid1271 TaxID=3411744 RepID=UPI003B9E1D16
MTGALAVLAVMVAAIVTVIAVISLRGRRDLTTPAERAVHATLHTASLAAKPLRDGLDARSAAAAAPHLRLLTGADALGIGDPDGSLLAWDGPWDELTPAFVEAAKRAVDGQRRVLVRLPLGSIHPVKALVVQPMLVDDSPVVGVLGAALIEEPGPGMLGAITEVARYACGQIELAELDASRARLDRAEVRALRAQISPHFIYNALSTIASFVRTDPDQARELVLEFADFTRYSFRNAGEFTVLADELRNIDRYLTLERARFGDSLQVSLQVAPEVLGVALPFLALQPLVENAVRHGLSRKADGGRVTIIAADEGTDAVISVEDDGVGMDPDLLRSGSLHTEEAAHVGLANVDDRLRAAFGNDYGLVVDTAPGAGTKVSMRVPKFRPGVRA